MVFAQPVVHEFSGFRVPTALLIGQRDRTAVKRDLASAELKAKLGLYPELDRRAARAIAHSPWSNSTTSAIRRKAKRPSAQSPPDRSARRETSTRRGHPADA